MDTVKKYRFHWNDPLFLECFYKNGFVVASSVIPEPALESIIASFSTEYKHLKAELWPKIPEADQSSMFICNMIRERHQTRTLIDVLVKTNTLLDSLERLLGPDISVVSGWELVISDPDDKSAYKTKPIHQEMWTGGGISDVFSWLPLAGVEKENSLLVIPGSHLLGLLPNRNRQLVVEPGVDYGTPLSLTGFQPGDIVFFHSLLLHGTAGIGSQLRSAITYIFKNTFAEISYKYRADGQTPLREGALTKIRRVLANDQFTPFRVYGGKMSNQPEVVKEYLVGQY